MTLLRIVVNSPSTMNPQPLIPRRLIIMGQIPEFKQKNASIIFFKVLRGESVLRTFWTSFILVPLDAKAINYLAICWLHENKRIPMCKYCRLNLSLMILAGLDFLVCSFLLKTNSWSIMPLKIPMINTFCLISHTYKFLQIDVFTYILSLSTTTLCGIIFAELCVTSFSLIKQNILNLSHINSMMRYPLCLSLKIGPGSFLLKMRNNQSDGNVLISTSCL